MAFGTIAQSKKPTFFENLIEQKKVAAPLFSVHLTRNQASGSEVCIPLNFRILENYLVLIQARL